MNRNNGNRNNGNRNNGNRNNGNRNNGNNRKGKNGNGNNMSSASFQQLQNEVYRNTTEGNTQMADTETNNSMRRAQEFINETRRRFNATQAERNEVERQMKETDGHINEINKILVGKNAGPAAVANAAAPIPDTFQDMQDTLYSRNTAAAAAPAAAAAAPANPMAPRILNSEERTDLKTLMTEPGNTLNDRIYIRDFISTYIQAKSDQDINNRGLAHSFKYASANMRLKMSIRILKNMQIFHKCIVDLHTVGIRNPNADLIEKYILICKEKYQQLSTKYDELEAKKNSNNGTKKNGSKNNGTKKNGNKNTTRRNAKNVGCSGFGCLPWFSGTRKTSKVTPL
jgi:hypothetical protein